MNTKLSYKELESVLEDAVDQYTLTPVIEMLSVIAREKAAHVEANWQDRSLAQDWERAAKQLNRAQDACERIGNPAI